MITGSVQRSRWLPFKHDSLGLSSSPVVEEKGEKDLNKLVKIDEASSIFSSPSCGRRDTCPC